MFVQNDCDFIIKMHAITKWTRVCVVPKMANHANHARTRTFIAVTTDFDRAHLLNSAQIHTD